MIGTKSSNCPKSCLTTKTKIIESCSYRAQTNTAYITFSDKVEVTEITLDKFSFLESFNFLGSNLGLWPGLGLFQLIEGIWRLLLLGRFSRSFQF